MKTKIIVLLGVLFVSFGAILVKLSSAPSLIIATYRLAFSTFLLMPVVLKNNREEIRSIDSKSLILSIISGVFLALHFATWITSIQYTSITSSTLLVNTHPIFIVLGSIFILKERISKKSIIYISIAFVGSIVISFGDSSLGSNILYGDLLAIAGGFFVACYMMIGRVARKKLSVNAYTFIVYSCCTLTLLLMDFATGTPLFPYGPKEWAIFLGLAVFCTLMGHSVFNWALAHLSPTYVSTAVLGEPVFATIWAILIFGQLPTVWQISGGAIILVGIALFVRQKE